MDADGRHEEGGADAQPTQDQPEPAAEGAESDDSGEDSWRGPHDAAPPGFDSDGRKRDSLGRIVPSRLNWLKFIRAVPSLIGGAAPAFRKEVPGEFFVLDADGDEAIAIVACPCGREARVPLARCVECECERFYLHLGTRVLVANTPTPEQRPTSVVH